jgi:protein-S-isoprenylcysteine O-methyltransferase Ste14
MATILFAAGAASAIPLLALLLATLGIPRLRIWPTPGPGTWQSIAFWGLFRALNVTTLGLAIPTILGIAAVAREPWLGLPSPVRIAGAAVAAVCGLLYLWSLYSLGRANTYCQTGGLVTHGLYRWTRNPQYATVIPSYAGLAIAADSGGVYVLSAALIAVYVLMAHAEEPWLMLKYGDDYRRYCAAVPRFFNVRRARAYGHFVQGRLCAAPRFALAASRPHALTIRGRRTKSRRLSHS